MATKKATINTTEDTEPTEAEATTTETTAHVENMVTDSVTGKRVDQAQTAEYDVDTQQPVETQMRVDQLRDFLRSQGDGEGTQWARDRLEELKDMDPYDYAPIKEYSTED